MTRKLKNDYLDMNDSVINLFLSLSYGVIKKDFIATDDTILTKLKKD